MWRTCLFCKKPLGSNEVVESFPVGRRLAFDAARGRLWVVCRSCRRWNLTPLEERWEAVETCEKLFRDTRLRTSSENIGLARHSEGLELVRIGRPLRPEFAAWRYGDQLGERRRRQILGLATGGPIGAAIYFSIPPLVSLAAVPFGLGLFFWAMRSTAAKVRVGHASAGTVVTPDNVARFRVADIDTIRILPHDREPHFRVEVCRGKRAVSFENEDARRVAGTILPLLNQWGATRAMVETAVSEIESHQHLNRFLARVAHERHSDAWDGRVGYVKSMPKPTRLALEMALHEDQERRALEGELWLLEQAWKEAEEIAAISDDLLLPAKTDAFFDRHGESG